MEEERHDEHCKRKIKITEKKMTCEKEEYVRICSCPLCVHECRWEGLKRMNEWMAKRNDKEWKRSQFTKSVEMVKRTPLNCSNHRFSSSYSSFRLVGWSVGRSFFLTRTRTHPLNRQNRKTAAKQSVIWFMVGADCCGHRYIWELYLNMYGVVLIPTNDLSATPTIKSVYRR